MVILIVIKWPPLYRITLGQHNSDNRMIQLTDIYCVLFRHIGPVISDYNKRLILLSVIQLSGGHCIHSIVTIDVNSPGKNVEQNLYL